MISNKNNVFKRKQSFYENRLTIRCTKRINDLQLPRIYGYLEFRSVYRIKCITKSRIQLRDAVHDRLTLGRFYNLGTPLPGTLETVSCTIRGKVGGLPFACRCSWRVERSMKTVSKTNRPEGVIFALVSTCLRAAMRTTRAQCTRGTLAFVHEPIIPKIASPYA